MHLHLSHGKFGYQEGAVPQSWIQPLYCLQVIAHHRLAIPSELDPLKKEAEDRYLKSRKDFTRIKSQILFNLRSNLLHKSLITLIYPITVKLMKMTLLLSNWTVHSYWTMMYNLHVCHPQKHTLDWPIQKNNASQVDGEFYNQEVCSKPKH